MSVHRLQVVFFLFVIGMLFDLLLIEHFESIWQLIPIVFLAVTLFMFLPVTRSKKGASFFRAWMYLGSLAGGLGLFFHVKSNWEFATELYADLTGWKLIAEVATGAIPVISPGFLVPISLFGLYLLRNFVSESEQS